MKFTVHQTFGKLLPMLHACAHSLYAHLAERERENKNKFAKKKRPGGAYQDQLK